MVDRSYWVIDEQGMVIDGKAGVGPNQSVRRALEAVNINTAAV
jgi:hypothetical protein